MKRLSETEFRSMLWHDGLDGINWSGSDEDFEFDSARAYNAYVAGDKGRLLWFLNFCLVYRRPIPDWVREKFCAAYLKGAKVKVRSWDEVFGRPLKKGKQLKAERRKREIAEKIWHRVMELHHKANMPIGKELFETVGEKLGIGGTLVSDIYYWLRKDIF